MKFEWDTGKALVNERRHHIDFATAARVFLDPGRLEEYDAWHNVDEDRWKVTGMVYPAVLVVIYTERGQAQDVIRIISARKANEKERKAYYAV
jgi:uncharacterized DUF497 family protein